MADHAWTVLLKHTLPAHDHSVPHARALTKTTLAPVIDDASLDVALLLVSEMTTNSVRAIRDHTGIGHVTLTLLIGRADSELRIEVADPIPDLVHLDRRMPDADQLDEGGRGLPLVATLSARYGVEVRRDHKIIWADLPVLFRDEQQTAPIPATAP